MFSNIPGIVVEIGGKTLPIEDPSELIAAIDSISYLHSIQLDSDDENDNDDEDNNNNNNSNNNHQNTTKVSKKKKHKRSKNK